MKCYLSFKKEEKAERTDKPYRLLIDCLMYLTLITRPDLCVAVRYLIQFQSCLTEKHWNARRVLRYIKGTLEFRLVFRAKDSESVIVSYGNVA